MYLVDTSIWIDFLRGRANARVRLLEELLEEGDAYTCEVTFAEVCFGARERRQVEKYFDYFAALPFLSPSARWHCRLAEMGWKLRTRGYQPFFADLYIALVALEHKATLLTSDRDFLPLAEIFGVRLE